MNLELQEVPADTYANVWRRLNLAVVLLALVATGIDGFFEIGTLGDAPFWKVLIYYVILFVLIEAVRVGIQKCIEKRDGKKGNNQE